MTVAQLIQWLQQFPDDMAVLVEGYENGYDPIHSLSIQELAGVQNAADYDGLFDTPNNLVMEIPGEKLTGIRAMARKDNGERLSCVVIAGLRGQNGDSIDVSDSKDPTRSLLPGNHGQDTGTEYFQTLCQLTK